MNERQKAVFELITTDKSFSKKANDLVKEIKSGAKENRIKAWFELIYEVCGKCGFGFYVGERNFLATRLMSHYGL